MHHRPDIDGLRAVAILPVLLFHAGVPGFAGGYVGVDVFFVISGYLITRLIAGEMAADRFSLLRFYERRARRILPALLAVILACLPFAHLLLLPEQYEDFGRSILATLGFVSNLYFLGQTGYFEDDVATMPLLHGWTLAVEEQFYLVFPLLLLLVARIAGRQAWAWTIAALLALSLGAAVLVARSDADAAFYLGPLRAWELMLGALLAVAGIAAPRRQNLAACLALAGLAMIVTAVALYDGQRSFSPLAMLLPCIGAALVILAGEGRQQPVGPAGRLLASRLPVGIGLISYSLYLWHWPILVFLQLWLTPEPIGLWAWPALALCGVLAVLSWRFVEQPFRRQGAERIALPRLAAMLAGGGALAATAALAIGMTSGAPWRLPSQAIDYLEAREHRDGGLGDCAGLDLEPTPANCSLGEDGSAASVLLWGDSHARVLAGTIDRLAEAADLGGIGLVRGGCPPLVGVDRVDEPGVCPGFAQSVMAFIEHNDVDVVVLHARWPMYVEGRRYGFEDGTVEFSGGDNATQVHDKLGELIADLEGRGIEVVLIGSVPEAGFDVPGALALAAWLEHGGPALHLDRDDVEARQRRSNEMLRELARRHGVPLIEPAAALCGGEACLLEKNGRSLYADEDHLSPEGIALLDPLLDPLRDELERAASRSRPPPERGPEGSAIQRQRVELH